MANHQKETKNIPWLKMLTANSSAGSFTVKHPTATAPSTAIDLRTNGGNTVHNLLKLIFYGTGNANTTFDARVWGWELCGTLYLPTILAQFNCTLGTETGLANQTIVATEKFVDTLALVSLMGNANVDNVILSPANDTIAHAVIDAKGCRYAEIDFDMTGASDANCLYKPL